MSQPGIKNRERVINFFILDIEASSRSIFAIPVKTYYDVEALESLLEERERDLELAARIGQTLLEKNRELVEQV